MNAKLEVVLSILAYSFCSGTLVLINKVLLHLLPYPSLVVIVQLWFAVIFVFSAKMCKMLEVDPIKWEFLKPYLYYTVLFCTGVFTNMKTLEHSNVETVIVFRAMAPCLVSILDVLFLGRTVPTFRSWFALALIVGGAMGYALEDEEFQSQGITAYFWPIIYLFIISVEMAYGKKIVRDVDLKTKSGPVLYTNILGWPPMLVFAYLGDEYSRFWDNIWLQDDRRLPRGALPLLFLGCVVGTGIGYSGWWCRSMVSATSYTLIGVINKCLTILLNVLIWDQHANAKAIASLFLCLVGGAIYKQAPLRSEGSTSPAEITPVKDEEAVELLEENNHDGSNGHAGEVKHRTHDTEQK